MGDTTTRRTVIAAPLADLCDRDPLDLDADPRLCPQAQAPAPSEPCGPLCTPWCLASHGPALHDR